MGEYKGVFTLFTKDEKCLPVAFGVCTEKSSAGVEEFLGAFKRHKFIVYVTEKSGLSIPKTILVQDDEAS